MNYNILLHPYFLVLYGILAWQFEQAMFNGIKFKERIGYVMGSLVWGSLIIIFDDEGIEFLQDSFDIILESQWYFYLGGGFFIDIIRTKILSK